MLLSKATYSKCIQPRVQTQNNKNQESNISFYKSTITNTIISAIQVLICFLIQI